MAYGLTPIQEMHTRALNFTHPTQPLTRTRPDALHPDSKATVLETS